MGIGIVFRYTLIQIKFLFMRGTFGDVLVLKIVMLS